MGYTRGRRVMYPDSNANERSCMTSSPGCAHCGGDMNRLQGKVAIVTGGAKGSGRAIADLFATEGARVVVGDIREPTLRFTHEGMLFLQTDVSRSDQVKALVDKAVNEFGQLDVLVNNAGIETEGGKTVVTLSEEGWNSILDVNLRGQFLGCKHAIPRMVESGGGSIINMGSTSASLSDPGMPAYNASKAAVVSLTRSVAIDHGPDGIRCNVVCPGWIRTDMTAGVLDQLSEEEEKRLKRQHPVGRFGEPADVANMALWLASDESAFASGHSFTIDGGLTAGSPIQSS